MPNETRSGQPEDLRQFSGADVLLMVPTSASQREISSSRTNVEGSVFFHESVCLRFDMPLDVSTLTRALDALIARHDTLRSTLSTDGLMIRVWDSVSVDVPFVDCSDKPPDERNAAWARLLAHAVEEPFNLERGPLLRVCVLRFAPADYRATFTVHRIVCDRWSIVTLLNDWAALYSAFAKASASDDLTPLGFDQSDAGAVCVASIGCADDERYWLEELSGASPALDLPADRSRVATRTVSSRREDLSLEAVLIARLKKAGAIHQATLFATLLTGVAALLYRITSQDDLIVGVTVAPQSACADGNTLGCLMHLLPIRIQVQETQSFCELLRAVQSGVRQALAHGPIDLTWVVRPPLPHRDPSRSPVASVTFNYYDDSVQRLNFGGIDTHVSPNPRCFGAFDISLNAVERNGGVTIECEYDAELFDAATIRHWLAAYQQLLSDVASHVDREVDRLAIVPRAALDLLDCWNSTSASFPQICIHQLIEAQVHQTPEAKALQCEGVTISYGGLNHRANQVARQLRALGVGKDCLVGICIERSIEMVVGLLGVLKAGGAYVPLDPAYPADRLAFMVRDSGMSVLLTEGKLRQSLPLSASQVLCIDDAAISEQAGEDLPCDPLGADPHSVAYVIYTSGSTGRPNGVLVSHRSVVNLLTSLRDRLGMATKEVVLALTTLSFDIAVSELLLPLAAGASIVIATREIASDGSRLLRLLRDAHVTLVDATPSTWRLLIDAGWNGGEGLKAICTGEAMPLDLAAELVARAGRVWNAYGPTEATVWSTFWEIVEPPERILIGRPIANTRIHVLDERMQPVPIGVRGELYIGGAGVSSGYLNRPELTRQRFVLDPFDCSPESRLYRTGDVARILPCGDIECLGRNDDQVKVRGFRIELGEIEHALSMHGAVHRVAVVAREDRPGVRRLIACLVLRNPCSPTDGEFRAHLHAVLPDYMIPASFVRLDTLPLTPSGKVDRRTLLTRHTAEMATKESFVAPRTPIEAMLAQLWRAALGVDSVSVHDNFFALGGDSLSASHVLARLRKDHGIEVLFRTLFEAPTLAQFAGVIERDASSIAKENRAIAHSSRESLHPLSMTQERMWLLEQMHPQQCQVHNLPAAWTLVGKLDEDCLERSLREIIARHEALRSRIRVQNGIPFQEVVPVVSSALRRLDLRDRPETKRETAMRAFVDHEMATPYDTSVAPLFRATLIRLDEHKYVLFVLPHSLVWDGWSFDIFLRELGALYTAFTLGKSSPLEPPLISYGDFARWQREWLENAESLSQREWWRARLEGDLPVLELPADRARPAEPSRAGANVEIRLLRDEVDKLVEIAHGTGGTLFTILFAAYCLLLHRLTERNDLLIGTIVRERTRPETEGLIGPFMNMLALRSQFDPNATFVEFLARVRDTTLDAFSRQEVPLEAVDVHAPKLHALFSFEDTRHRALTFGGLHAHQLHLVSPTCPVDLRLWAVETETGVMATLNYSTDLFDEPTMRRFLGRFRTLLRAAARDPLRKTGELELISVEERSVLYDFGEPKAGNEPVSVCTQFEQHAQRTPEAVAIEADGQKIDYGTLERRAYAITQLLRTRGIRDGSRVAVYLKRSIELVTSLIAVMKAGAMWVPLDPIDPPTRVAAILADSGAELVLTSEQLRAELPTESSIAIAIDEVAESAPEVISEPVTRVPIDTSACLLYRSSANGQVRGAVLTHRALSSVTEALIRQLPLARADVMLALSPPSLDVSVIELIAPLAAGGRVVLTDDDVASDPRRLGNVAAGSLATVMIAPTALWRDMLAGSSLTWPTLKVVCIGNLPPPNATTELEARTAGVWFAHGFADTGIWSTLLRLTSSQPSGILGRPLHDVRVRILDAKSRDVPIGVVGNLCVGRVGCSIEYAGAVGRHDHSLVTPADGGDRLYRTNERVRWRSDGTLELVQQAAREALVNGFRIDLEEVAITLRHHPALEDAVVVRQSQGPSAARLVAYVVPHAGHCYTDTELRRALGRTLPAHMIPRAFVELDSLPRTSTGEIDLQYLGSLERSPSDEYATPASEMERFLGRVWQEALGLERVGLHDNFFSLGGYSLLCFQVLERIERATSRRINPRVLLLDSLQQVAERLENTPPTADHRGFHRRRNRGILHRLGRLLPGSV